MPFTIRAAVPADAQAIIDIIGQACAAMPHPEWFLRDDLSYIAAHIDSAAGFCVVAQDGKGGLAGYAAVKLPGTAADALGRKLGWPNARLARTAQLDSYCVRPGCQGRGLGGRLLAAAEARVRAGAAFDTLLATVHPDNAPSLRAFTKAGYTVAAPRQLCYGGLLRHILQKGL